MDRTAIEAIAQYTEMPNLADVTDIPAIVIPENNKVESLERLLQTPTQFIAHFKTNILDEFSEYFKSHSQIDDSAIFINPEKMSALAIFDLGDYNGPLWGKHRSTLTLKKTAAFDAVLNNDREAFTQQQLIDFANDWDICINFFDEDDAPITYSTALNRIRRLTVSNLKKSDLEIGNFNAEKTAMESVEINAGNARPPAKMAFVTKPYNGFDAIELELDIRAVVKNDNIALQYRIVGRDSLLESLSDIFKQKLFEKMPETHIHIGDIVYR